MIQAYPFKSAEIFKTKLKGFPCNFVLIFFKKLKGLQVTGDPFNFKTPLHKNPCKTPVNPFKHLQCSLKIVSYKVKNHIKASKLTYDNTFMY